MGRGTTEMRDAAIVGPPVPAIADPHRVRQVVRNLVANATRHGATPIRVEVGWEGDSAYLRVVDHGEGVVPELAESVFEPYVRARGSESQPGSVGLGLTISRRLARLMGGDVTYHRRDGQTWFVLTLPRSAPQHLAA